MFPQLCFAIRVSCNCRHFEILRSQSEAVKSCADTARRCDPVVKKHLSAMIEDKVQASCSYSFCCLPRSPRRTHTRTRVPAVSHAPLFWRALQDVVFFADICAFYVCRHAKYASSERCRSRRPSRRRHNRAIYHACFIARISPPANDPMCHENLLPFRPAHVLEICSNLNPKVRARQPTLTFLNFVSGWARDRHSAASETRTRTIVRLGSRRVDDVRSCCAAEGHCSQLYPRGEGLLPATGIPSVAQSHTNELHPRRAFPPRVAFVQVDYSDIAACANELDECAPSTRALMDSVVSRRVRCL